MIVLFLSSLIVFILSLLEKKHLLFLINFNFTSVLILKQLINFDFIKDILYLINKSLFWIELYTFKRLFIFNFPFSLSSSNSSII